VEAEFEGTGNGDRDAGKQDIEFAALQRRQALLGGGVSEFNLVRITEDGDGQRAAIIDEETLPAAVAVR
jgi:hypothetical protein